MTTNSSSNFFADKKKQAKKSAKNSKLDKTKFYQSQRLATSTKIRALITQYEQRIKSASKMAKDETPTGYFQRGRKAAYESVILDLMQIVQREH